MSDDAHHTREPRWLAIDQTRGAAMCLVWLSHFALAYFRWTAHDAPAARLIGLVTKTASPTFVIVSGALVGWLSARAANPRRIHRRFVDRGLFLLIVAHPVIWVAHIAYAGSAASAARVLFMTDTIGACLLLAPTVVARVGHATRLLAAGAAFSIAWGAIAIGGGDPPGGLVGEFVFGSLRPDQLEYAFPLLQWMSVFIAATVLGERLHALKAQGLGAVARSAWRGSLALFGVAAVTAFAHAAFSPRHPILWVLTASYQKEPPGVLYLAGYGAISLAIFASFVELDRRWADWRVGNLLALIGRCSLFAFVAQYFVYYTGLELLHPVPSRWWPVWFALSAALLVAAVAAWDAIGGNRWLTLGLGRGERRVEPATLRAAGSR